MTKTSQSKSSAIVELVKNTLRTGRMVWEDRKGLILLIVFLLILSSAAPFVRSGVQALLINELVRIAGSGTVSAYLGWLLGASVFIAAIFALLDPIRGYLDRLFYFFIGGKFELLILKKKATLDVAIHEDPKKSNLISKIKEEGTWHLKNFADRQFQILQAFLMVLFAAAVILTSQWWIFLLIFIGTFPELLHEAKHGRHVWDISQGNVETKRRYWDLHWRLDRLSSIVELKIFQNIWHIFGMIKELYQKFQDDEKKLERRILRGRIATLLLSQTVMAVATIWFVIEVVHGEMKIGTYTFVMASVGNFRGSLSDLFRQLGIHYQDSLFVTNIFELLDTKPTIESPPNAISLSQGKTPEIVFDNVTFSYPGSEKVVLKDFSLRISPGEKIAFVGVNGAGKTTLTKLIFRFYDPISGKITIDGHDLKTIDLESWYEKIGLIAQDYSNYNFLVKEAIALGRTSAPFSPERVKRSAVASESDRFIEEWTQQYDQMLGRQFSGGVEPSVGQWQKLALARAFYREPGVLILDEPTSSIDAEAEAKIFEKMEALPKDRTVILISHRFSTVRRADRIGVLVEGNLKEIGTHEELLKLNGTYARLFHLQAKGYR